MKTSSLLAVLRKGKCGSE